MIHLFRHADAGKREDWSGPDEERPLSDQGHREAIAVAAPLADMGITRILTSPYVRCVQSVVPLSAATGIPLEIETSLAEGAPGPDVDALVAGLKGGSVLCSHGDVVSGLIRRVAAEGANLQTGLIWEKGSVWHLTAGAGGRVEYGRYEPPPVTAA